jgi:hypothetical protein
LDGDFLVACGDDEEELPDVVLIIRGMDGSSCSASFGSEVEWETAAMISGSTEAADD